jgi:hypothetical protein
MMIAILEPGRRQEQDAGRPQNALAIALRRLLVLETGETDRPGSGPRPAEHAGNRQDEGIHRLEVAPDQGEVALHDLFAGA